MHKRFFPLAVALVLLTGCTARLNSAKRLPVSRSATSSKAAKSAPAGQALEYRREPEKGKKDGFTFKYPRGWKASTVTHPITKNVLATLAKETSTSGNNAILVINSNATKAQSPVPALQAYQKIMQREYPDAKVTIKEFTLNGFTAARVDSAPILLTRTAVLLSHDQAGASGLPGRSSLMIVYGPLSPFVIHYTVPDSETAAAKVLDDMLKTFTILPAGK